MAELWAWARSRARRRAPVRAASRRAPSSTAMPVRVTQRSQDRQPNASKASHDGSAQNVKFYNPLGGLQANIREAWSKEEEVEKGIKNLTYIERLKERVKKVKIPELRSAPHSSPDLVPERKRTMPMNPAKFFRRLFRTVSQRPIRERVIHLLALKNYKKSELLACLEREGVVEKDKESLGKILQEVANLDANENSFSLKEHFFKDIQLDWPGYSERDRKTLEVTLFQKTAPSQNATSTSQSPSLGPSERDTPLRTAQKRPLASAFVNPVMTKKQRIDQEPSDVQPAASGCSSSSLDLPSTSCSTLNLSPSVSSISTSTCELQQKDKIRTLSGIPAPVRVQGKTPESKGEKIEVRGAQQNNSGPVPEKKKMMHVRLADIDWSGCAAVYGRPYKDRVIHLLALRDYKEPELLARLQRDGVRQKDKDSLGKILQQVANLNAKDNSYSLKEHLFQTLQTDWPGYSKTDRKNLKLILSRKSASSQNATNTTQMTSLRPSERDAPARPAQKRPLASDFTSPVMSRKRRIGHQHSHVQLAAGGHFSSFLLPSTSLFTSDMSPSVGSISPCTRVVQETEKFQSSSTPVPARVQKEIPNSNKKKNELGRLKQLHPLDFDEGSRKDTSIASTSSATSNQPDYLRKYVAIVSLEQRQRYKDDFNAEYEEYRNLHSQIDKTIKKFRWFQEQLKSLTPGSKAYQGSPSFSEMKSRCQYLHKKLSHIQSRISEFDQQ